MGINGALGSNPALIDKVIGSSYDTVRFVAENIEFIKHVSAHMAEVYRVYGSIEAVDALIENIAKIDTLSANLDAILDAAADIGDITLVATNIAAVNAVQVQIANILAVNAKLPQIETLATNVAALTNLNTSLAQLTSIYNSLAALTDIHNNMDALFTGIEQINLLESRIGVLEVAKDDTLLARDAAEASALAASTAVATVAPVSHWAKQSRRLGPLVMAVYGDSRAASSHVQDGSRLAAYGLAGWVQYVSRGRVVVPADLNFGVNGETSVQAAARVAAVADSRADAVLMIVSTNDAQTVYPDSVTAIDTAVDALLAAGKLVFLVAETPRGNTANGGGFSGSRLAQHLAIHRHIKRMRKPGLFPIDCWSSWIDPTATDAKGLSAVTYDALHPSPAGCYYIAAEVAKVLETLVPEPTILPWSNADAYNASYNPFGNLVLNPLMLGITGTKAGTGSPTGDVADSYTLTATANLVTVASKVTANGKTWQQLAIAGTPTNVSQTVILSQAVNIGGLNVGDYVEAVCETEVDVDATELYGPMLELVPTGGASQFVSGMFHNPQLTYGQSPAFVHKGIIRTPPFLVTTGLGALALNLTVKGLNGVAGDMTFRSRGFSVQKVIP